MSQSLSRRSFLRYAGTGAVTLAAALLGGVSAAAQDTPCLRGEPALLASCYKSSLEVAAVHGIRTVDFPSISTGVYGYPLPQASTVALKAIMDFLRSHDLPQRVRMVCHTEQAAAIYRQTWNLWYAEDKDMRL